MTHAIRVEPAGRDIQVEEGETLFDAAEREGWTWPTICHGDGECLTCWVEIVSGSEHAGPVGPIERKGLDAMTSRRALALVNGTVLRLACQLRFAGDAVVQRQGPRPLGS